MIRGHLSSVDALSECLDVDSSCRSRALLSNLGTSKPQAKKRKKTQEKKAERKAAKTLSAILLTFIITWTPYNILVLVKPLTSCADCIPPALWDFFYYLCYINSTINPMCYALCNASFRRTYVRILKCKWHNRNRTTRGFYNWWRSDWGVDSVGGGGVAAVPRSSTPARSTICDAGSKTPLAHLKLTDNRLSVELIWGAYHWKPMTSRIPTLNNSFWLSTAER